MKGVIMYHLHQIRFVKVMRLLITVRKSSWFFFRRFSGKPMILFDRQKLGTPEVFFVRKKMEVFFLIKIITLLSCLFASSLLDVCYRPGHCLFHCFCGIKRCTQSTYNPHLSPYLQDTSESCRPRMEGQRGTRGSTGQWERPWKMSRWGFLAGGIAKG